MGKNKQRTKGNVRPSSSGRAAELLARDSGVVPGFVGFGSTVTSELGYVPAVHGVEEIDILVDADFRLVLRKMSKRDTVTKLKAIQEFGSMCQERDAEEVKGVLPYWPRIYCKISVDHDRRVREATQQAFVQLVLKVRRSLAPFLKSLMGYWLMAQCDTYVPAASAACLAFTAAFPPSKQPEALSFCRDEILNVLQDTLLKETADTLSDPQSVPEEERETKFIRMVTSSLLGVKKLLRLLPDSDRTALEDRLTQLIGAVKFWKYSKHKMPQVRGALFEVVSALCQYTPGLVDKEAARASSAVLLAIDDTDPLVLPPLWEAVLHVVTTIPDCWTHVNARKGFLPKLWSLLRDAGGGMAKALHPNLMPLISKLPPQVTEPALDFYTTFFTSLIQGLAAERAMASPTESAAIVTAVVECMRLRVLHHVEEGEEQRKIERMLLSQQLLPLLESAVRTPSLQKGPLFLLVTEMLISWEKRAGLQGANGAHDGVDVFKTLLADFWEGLGLLLVGFVDVEEADQKALEGVATLLQVMRYPDQLMGRKKSVKICFSEPGDTESNGTEGGSSDDAPEGEPRQTTAVGSLESERLEDVVCQLAQLCLLHVDQKRSEGHLVFLSLLLHSFHTPRVFAMLMESEGREQPGAELSPPVVELNNAAMRFLLERVVAWLSEEGRSHGDHVVDMIFSPLHCCSPQETTRFLNHITTMSLPWGILLHFIQKVTESPETLGSCRDWLKGSVLGERLLGLAEELCNTGQGGSTSSSKENTHSWTLINLVLSQHHNDSVMAKLRAVCVAGVTALKQHSGDLLHQSGFLYSAAVWVKKQLLTASLDTKSLQVLVSAVQGVVETLTAAPSQNLSLLTHFVSPLTPSQPEWTQIRRALPPQWMKGPLLSGRLRMTCDSPSMDAWKATLSSQLPAHLCACALLGRVTQTAAVSLTDQQKAEWSFDSVLKYTVSELLYAFQWCVEMDLSLATVSQYHKLLSDWGLWGSLPDLVPVRDLLETLYTRSVAEGGLWSLCLERRLRTDAAGTGATDNVVRRLYGDPGSWFPVSEAKLSTLRTTKEKSPVQVEVLQAVLASMMEWSKSREDWSLCGSDLSKASADQLILTVEMIRFLSWLVSNSPSALGESQWDFLLCSVLAWVETACKNVSSLGNPWVQLFVCENAALISVLSRFFSAPPVDVTLPAELRDEWACFFVEAIYNVFAQPDDPLFPLAVLRSVGVALTHVPVQQLRNNSLPACLTADRKTNLPEALQTLLNTLCPLLLFKARPLQVTVYLLLEKVMDLLSGYDMEGESSKTDDDDTEEPSLSPPESLMEVLSACEDLCESVLAGVQVGEFALFQPLSVEYSCFLGYLLSWKLLLSFFKASPSHLRVQYSLYLKRSHSLHKLLIHLFKVMPENPVYPGQSTDTKTFFTESLSLDVDKTTALEWELPHLACGVYYGAVQDLPAMVRLWWTSQEKRVSTVVERFTARHVSPVLSAREIASVHTSTQTFDSMTVKARSAAREVIANYSVDDISIELVIQLPQNHPLGSITVESGRRVGVANGSIMEGLALWKTNVDKRFEGVEDCMICFSVIHGSNYSLPKKACRTCKKKFHSACLYKWFTSSNKSTCPLCRESFF
ncbi:hypothetical protein NHX12_010304 [Muraenolepis orangiensis]|uniref:E3 ubiquitin-protein ligase listerin n=1 Tax=Muraenolepis orangiensis TaxID=630683 RepID=A0A9Q0DHY9_9TELE|nr:hypothetical protein NHX12_010304 [Muraenolepis orangiensis]